MRPFVAAYVTTNGKEWDRPLCVEKNSEHCKQKFCDWYAHSDYSNISVRYVEVKVIEAAE